MDAIIPIVEQINAYVWGPIMLGLILGTGIYLSIGLKGLTLTKLPLAFKSLWRGRKDDKSVGDITPFNALMTSLSATIGTGNIAGVATAIALGGPGALFWMWLTAIVGMATKYAEAVLAVHFRQTNHKGEHVGGPMYYIRYGLGKKWSWLAFLFSLFGIFAAFGIGNTVQSNSVADGLSSAFSLDTKISGFVMMGMVAAVILGGIKRIADVAGKLVPVMGISYVLAGLVVLALNIEAIPAAFATIIDSAFTGHAATGGFAGATMMAALRFGVARGIFSNEAGLGSAPIAHAHAKTHSPFNQGLIAMLGTFIDTLIICSITGLAIIVTGVWETGGTGAPLTSAAFESSLPGIGQYIVAVSLAVFAFTTMIGWSIYGERCASYIFGDKVIVPFRVLWILAVPVGALADLEFIWLMADTFNALMAIPNLIALALLSPVLFAITKKALEKHHNK
ncbi:MAG: sodium:alanine symporter family protein [Pseudomonadales bacterium]|nr:sodium:alanine symporter family protein [Pseudomonadales bacterium]